MGGSVDSIAALVGAAARCRNAGQLRGVILDRLGEVVGTDLRGIYEFDAAMRPLHVDQVGAPPGLLARYEQKCVRTIDVVMDDVSATNLPTHNLNGRSAAEWRRTPLYTYCVAPFGFEHVIVGPLFGGGRIIGTFHAGRRKHERPFDEGDLRKLTVVCAHVSSLIAQLAPGAEEDLDRLSAREREVAMLVAAGLNNLEVARCLSISRNTVKEFLKRTFVKLEVDSRAELAARVSAWRSR